MSCSEEIFEKNELIIVRTLSCTTLLNYHRTSTAKLYLDRSVADHSVNESSNVRLQGLGSTYVAGDKFDEEGYIVLPPCLWGSKSEGLEPPVYLPPGTPVFSIKRNRNTHQGHFGEMASWQMRGVNFPAQ